MNCPHCTANTTVRATRGEKRYRECANQHRFTTIEITEPELKRLEQIKALAQRLKGLL